MIPRRALETETSVRLARVTLPLSRELKWPWPAFLLMILPVRVMVMRLARALWVFMAIELVELVWKYQTIVGGVYFRA